MLMFAGAEEALEGSETARTEGARRGGCEEDGERSAVVGFSPNGLVWSPGVVVPEDPSTEPGETGPLSGNSSGVLAAETSGYDISRAGRKGGLWRRKGERRIPLRRANKS